MKLMNDIDICLFHRWHFWNEEKKIFHLSLKPIQHS